MAADLNKIDETAKQILRDNDRGGRYTVPRAGLYPFQWNWDSCFSAMGWAVFDAARGWKELETLFENQWPGGMVPHIVFHEKQDTYFPGPDIWRVKNQAVPTSGITQPPVAATVVRRMYENASDRIEARRQAGRLIPKLFLNHHWWHHQRDPEQTGLVAVYHPWETGRDNSPEWDEPLRAVPKEGIAPYKRRDLDHVQSDFRPTQDDYDRYVALLELFRAHDYDQEKIYGVTPFRVADAGINFILLRANRDLLWLMEEMGDSDDSACAQVASWVARQERAVDTLWDGEKKIFCSRDLLKGKNIADATSASFLSFYAGAGRKEQADAFAAMAKKAGFMVPSFDPADARFDRRRYWRGPVWAVVNFMIAKGFSESGYADMARRVGGDTARLIAQNGFWEYFDPVGGDGMGGNAFSWTAAVWLSWARFFLDEADGL